MAVLLTGCGPIPNLNRVNFVNCIQSSGMQHINTGINPNGKIKVIMDAQMGGACATGKYYAYFGATAGGLMFGVDKATSSTWNLYWKYNKSYSNIFSMDETTFKKRRTITVDCGTATIDGASKSYAQASFSIQYPIFLFALNSGGMASSITPMLLFSCQIYDDGTLVREFWPCLDPDGVACLYDLVSQEYFYNAGSGEFTVG